MQGEKDLLVPREFVRTLDDMLGILGPCEDDQLGFLARLAYADAAGFEFPHPIWDYVGRAKRKTNKAGWLTDVIREELGPERWDDFQRSTPSPAHCQRLLAQQARAAG